MLRLTPKEAPRRRGRRGRARRPSVADPGRARRGPRAAPLAGPATKRVAEFYLDGVKKRPDRPSTCPPTARSRSGFTDPQLDPAVGLHQGEVRLGGDPDPLAFDDSRYFSFTVQPAAEGPDRLRPGRSTPSSCATRSTPIRHAPRRARRGPARSSAAGRRFAAMTAEAAEGLRRASSCSTSGACPTPPGSQLNGYVREGGGLVVGLGDRIDRENYNGAGRRAAPAGPLGEVGSPGGADHVRQGRRFTHPLFQPLLRRSSTPSSRASRSSSYWAVKPPRGPRTLLCLTPTVPRRCSSGPSGGRRTGRVLLWTTPLSRRADAPVEPAAWNEFPLAVWSFFALMNQTVPYLAGTAGEQLNYEAGEDVVLPIDPARRFTNYSSRARSQDARSAQPPGDATTPLVDRRPAVVGQWTVTASGADGTDGRPSASASTRRSTSPSSSRWRRATSTPLFGEGRLQAGRRPARASRRDRPTIRDRPRDLPLDHGPDPDPRDGREPPGQPVPPRGTAAPGRQVRDAPICAVEMRHRPRPDGLLLAKVAAMSLSFSPIGPWPLVVARGAGGDGADDLGLPAADAGDRGRAGAGWRWGCGWRRSCSACWRRCGRRWSSRRRRSSRPRSIFLIDDSSSMKITDEVSGQKPLGRGAEDPGAGARPPPRGLGPNLDVKYYRFDADLREHKPDDPSPARGARDGPGVGPDRGGPAAGGEAGRRAGRPLRRREQRGLAAAGSPPGGCGASRSRSSPSASAPRTAGAGLARHRRPRAGRRADRLRQEPAPGPRRRSSSGASPTSRSTSSCCVEGQAEPVATAQVKAAEGQRGRPDHRA